MEIGRERNGGGGEERRERGGKKRARLWAPARAEATSIRPSGWHGNTTLSPWWAPAVPRLGAICSRLGDAGHGIACWRAPLAPASANAGQRQGPRCRSCSAHTGLFTAHYPNSALQLSIRPAAPVASYLTHECPPVHSPPLPRPPPALPSDPAICHRAPNSPDSSINHSVSSSGQPHVLILGSLSQGPLPTRRRTRSHPPPWVRHPRAQAPPSPLRL